MKTLLLALAAALTCTGIVAGAPAPIVVSGAAVPWSPRSGSEFALLEGSMTAAGPYTFRIKFLQPVRSDPETHSSVDHIVVLSGTFYIGFGKRFERNRMRALSAGSFVAVPAGAAHFTLGVPGTTIQVYGVGPRITQRVTPV